jgi:hypothetical protein
LRNFKVIGRDGNARFSLHRGAQLVVGFAGDNLSRRTKFRTEQPANNRAREFPRANETEAVAGGGCL